LGLSIIGAPNAFLIGFMAGIFNLVPYIGPYGRNVPWLASYCHLIPVRAFGNDGNTSRELGAYSSVAQLVDNFFTQPVIFANRVHAHPLEIFIVISIAGNLAGTAGMVLAIPAYTLFRIVGQELFSGFKVIDELTKNLEG
jgi:predicted PurR-regulated permease PerM